MSRSYRKLPIYRARPLHSLAGETASPYIRLPLHCACSPGARPEKLPKILLACKIRAIRGLTRSTRTASCLLRGAQASLSAAIQFSTPGVPLRNITNARRRIMPGPRLHARHPWRCMPNIFEVAICAQRQQYIQKKGCGGVRSLVSPIKGCCARRTRKRVGPFDPSINVRFRIGRYLHLFWDLDRNLLEHCRFNTLLILLILWN